MSYTTFDYSSFKIHDFQDELEWRIFALNIFYKDKPLTPGFDNLTTEDASNHFIEIPFDNINSIVFGPNVNKSEELEIKEILNAGGYDLINIEINNSKKLFKAY